MQAVLFRASLCIQSRVVIPCLHLGDLPCSPRPRASAGRFCFSLRCRQPASSPSTTLAADFWTRFARPAIPFTILILLSTGRIPAGRIAHWRQNFRWPHTAPGPGVPRSRPHCGQGPLHDHIPHPVVARPPDGGSREARTGLLPEPVAPNPLGSTYGRHVLRAGGIPSGRTGKGEAAALEPGPTPAKPPGLGPRQEVPPGRSA